MPCDTLQFTIGSAGIEIVMGVHVIVKYALRYFTIYNWRRWNRNVIVKYALRYFTITCTGKDQALHLQLACTITAALQLTAMLWLNTFHNSTFRLFRISNTHARLQACKVHSVCNMHSTLYSECMCMVHTGSATWLPIQSNFANRLTDDNGFLIGKVRMRSYNDNSHISHN